jgi:hypothetical protein
VALEPWRIHTNTTTVPEALRIQRIISNPVGQHIREKKNRAGSTFFLLVPSRLLHLPRQASPSAAAAAVAPCPAHRREETGTRRQPLSVPPPPHASPSSAAAAVAPCPARRRDQRRWACAASPYPRVPSLPQPPPRVHGGDRRPGRRRRADQGGARRRRTKDGRRHVPYLPQPRG